MGAEKWTRTEVSEFVDAIRKANDVLKMRGVKELLRLRRSANILQHRGYAVEACHAALKAVLRDCQGDEADEPWTCLCDTLQDNSEQERNSNEA